MKGQKSFRHNDPSRLYSKDTERDKQIVRLLKLGHGKRRVAKEVGCSKSTVEKVCFMNGIDLSENAKKMLTDDDIQMKLGNGWEYVGGYTGYYGSITVRCTKCGSEKKILWRSVSQIGECSCIKTERKAQKETEKVLAFWDELQKPRPLHNDIVIAFCRNCGKPFVKDGRSNCCSEKCSNSVYKARRYRHDDRRLRRINASECDSITLDALINRDGLECWICGELCDLEDSFWIDKTFYAGNRYPSIDHVVPLAKGGTHTWDNVRVAHRICNTIKRDKILKTDPASSEQTD